MPAYFYHLSLRLFQSSSDSSLSIQSAWDALRPFQSPSSSSTRSPTEHTPPTPDTIAHHQLSTRKASTPPRIHSDLDSGIGAGTPTLREDNRFSAVTIESINMVPRSHELTRRSKLPASEPDNLVAAGIGTDILGGLRTRGRYIPVEGDIIDSVSGIVQLYRDAHETPFLNDGDYPTYLKGSAAAARHPSETLPASSKDLSAYPFPAQTPDEDCKTLCILAVPSYMSPTDFFGFTGETTMDDVSHFRMIRTARFNRYMVLMKFRSGKKARDWQKEWNGKVFNSMEPETCHVVFVKTVEIQVVDDNPDFLPVEHALMSSPNLSTPSGQATLTGKPLAPPTPALIELPTCPVCLERMDETTGLLTIICQHVFHCTCLQKWKGSGCPVCRYTQDDSSKSNAGLKPEEEEQECNVCHTEENLWACLICGTVGCGRYDGAHAFEHWKETAHAFSMDLTSQRVWDYVGDSYVHRIIQSKIDGKLVELPAADNSALDPDWNDAVPREKLENMSLEYTHLLTSQLESQRAYFEEVVERAVDKASKASAANAASEINATNAADRLESLQSKFDTMALETMPGLDNDRSRAEKRADKFEALTRSFEKKYQEERAMNQNMMLRLELLEKELQGLKVSNADLAEQNRDLTFFISSSQRLQGQGEDVEQGTVSVPDPPKKKNKRKGKK